MNQNKSERSLCKSEHLLKSVWVTEAYLEYCQECIFSIYASIFILLIIIFEWRFISDSFDIQKCIFNVDREIRVVDGDIEKSGPGWMKYKYTGVVDGRRYKEIGAWVDGNINTSGPWMDGDIEKSGPGKTLKISSKRSEIL